MHTAQCNLDVYVVQANILFEMNMNMTMNAYHIFLQRSRDNARRQQNQHHEVGDLSNRDFPHRDWRSLGQFILTYAKNRNGR